ncbi:MAG: hypothetical protein Q4D05_05180 [Acinetobacter sp.]|nr:hypothetical protein [Acinetobacter sp.]
MNFTAYDCADTSLQIDDLTIESHADVVDIYGNLQISKDQQGLAKAQQLAQIMQQIVGHLQQIPHLPEQRHFAPREWIDNPFLADDDGQNAKGLAKNTEKMRK